MVHGPTPGVTRSRPRREEHALRIRKLDALGYARFRRWRVYAEEGHARLPVALWLGEDDLTVQYGADTLSSYDVSFSPGETKLKAVTNPRLFATRHRRNWPQLKLLGLEEVLGEVSVASSSCLGAVVEVDHAVAETVLVQQFEVEADVSGERPLSASYHDGHDEQVPLVDQPGLDRVCG